MSRACIRSSVLAAVVLMWAAAVAGAATPVVREPEVCLECHPGIGDEFKVKHVHTAFANGECSGCHNPHASKHAGLLAADGRVLCLNCHQDMGAASALAYPHPPVANGDCLGCHEPHASAHAGQLKLAMEATCITCHAPVAEWKTRAVVHAPVAAGDCRTCHQPHGSALPGMLGKAVPGMCFDCHESGAAFTKVHGGRDISGSDCVACHDPHASDQKALLRANQHAPFASGNCVQCHKGVDNGGSFAMVGSSRDLCLGCHRGVGTYAKASNRHILDSEESCVACHNPHAANTTSLLLRDQAQLCMGCHFNDKEDKAAWVTHPGVECSECHEPHGNNDRQLIKKRDTMLCGQCHAAAHDVTHPVGPEVIDPRTGESVTCLSCHQLHGARFEQYLPLSPQMELCVQCHKR